MNGFHRQVLMLMLVSACPSVSVASTIEGSCTTESEINSSRVLQPNCIYKQSLTITKSNVTLDCRGATLQGTVKDKIGLFIDSRGEGTRNILVKNCRFLDFATTGVLIGWRGQNKEDDSDREIMFSKAPSNITLENVEIRRSGRVGLYVDAYVRKVTLSNSIVEESGGVGVYLEHSSQQTTLKNNRIARNGNGKTPREGVAIDSSAMNEIRNNVISNNSRGGIFLYKNCGEGRSKGTQNRWQHSNQNVIAQNKFFSEDVGVWIASRQSQNLKAWDCSDQSMDDRNEYYRDFADENVVELNSFCRTAVAVKVEGDSNKIVNNSYDGDGVQFPVTQREKILRLPQRGNVSKGNFKTVCMSQNSD